MKNSIQDFIDIYIEKRETIKKLEQENEDLKNNVEELIMENQDLKEQLEEFREVEARLAETEDKNKKLEEELNKANEEMNKYKAIVDKHMSAINNAEAMETKGSIFGGIAKWAIEGIVYGVGSLKGAYDALKQIDIK